MSYDKAYFDWFEAGIADPGIHYGIAESIHSAFQDDWPVLEVGCGRGYITSHLSGLYGIENVFGADVSLYASSNPVTPGLNIRAANIAVDRLLWPDRFFGLVYTWQLLEHLHSESAANRALWEMSRLSSKYQFHSIRVLESGAGEDPTHVLMRPRSWWIEAFSNNGWIIDPERQAILEEVGKWHGNKELFVLVRKP